MRNMESSSSAFSPADYSDAPIFNIQAVAAATGVPSITLRSWERRYGVPEPKRDAKGYRLYSDRDIAIARWLRDRVQQGVGISRAIHMYQLLAKQVPSSPPEAVFDLSVLCERLVQAIRALDETSVSRVLSEGLMAASVEDVSMHLLQPALYRVGHMWAGAELTVTSEHFGSNLVRSHLAQLVRLTPPPLRDARMLIGCAPGEMHDIGALMLALFLRRRGFQVIYVGANLEPEDLIADVVRLQPAAVGLSASTLAPARAVDTVYGELQKQYQGLLTFGGRAFNEHPELVDGTRGTWLGADAATATARLEEALGLKVFI